MKRRYPSPEPIAMLEEKQRLHSGENSAAANGFAERRDSGRTSGTPTSREGVDDGLPGTLELEAQYKHTGPSAKWYHAFYHTITAVVGAGVLALPYSFSYLTWTGGIISLILATAVSLYTSYLLAALHQEEDGTRHNRYRDLGRAILGQRAGTWTIVPVQFAVMIGLGIAYTVTAGQSFQAIQNPLCNEHTVLKTDDHTDNNCQKTLTLWIVGFGVLQLFLSQLKDFHSLWWVSLLGGLMSALYSTIAFVASSVAVNSMPVSYSIRPGSFSDRLFGVFNAIASVAFSFGGHVVLLEIQATLAEPPAPVVSLMKGMYASYALVIAAYFSVAVSGFMAFGNTVNPDILLSISQPGWLIKVANFMVVVHVSASYQVFSQPVFEALEGIAIRFLWRGSQLPASSSPLALRLTIRTLYVVATTTVAAVFPFFTDLMGLIGALGFTPGTFIIPSLLWLKKRKPIGAERWLNIAIIIGSSILGFLGAVGSARNIVVSSKNYHL